MLKDRFSRLVFALVVLIALSVIGRNFYHRHLNNQLLTAVEMEDADAVRLLLDHGADANSKKPPPQGLGTDTPLLSLAIKFPNMTSKAEKIACLLIVHGANIRENPYLEQACRAGSVQVARCLLDRGANPNLKDVNGYTALTDAISVASIRFSYGGGLQPLSPEQAAANRRQREISRELVQLLRQRGAHLTLVQAVELNDRAELKAQLEAGVPADQHEKHGSTALQKAIEKDDLETAKLLLAHGADVNFQDEAGQSALDSAAYGGRLETVKLLLAHGAKVNIFTKYSGTPLQSAIVRRHADVARLLLAQGADCNAHSTVDASLPHFLTWSPFVTAIGALPELVPDLLRHGADVNTGYGEPLRAAIRSRHLDLVRELLRRGANVNPPRPYAKDYALAYRLEPPFTPLMVAAFAGPEYEAVLRQAGARVDDVDKQTVLPQGVRIGQVKVISALLALGAAINVVDSSGKTPLTEAVVYVPSAVKMLLERGADPNQTNRMQDTPLYLAVKANRADIARLLLAHGANVNAQRLHGHTALYYARRHHQADIVALLQKRGAKDE